MKTERRRLLLIAGADIMAALIAALVVFRLFGAVSGVDTNPPVCYSEAGGEVSCALTPAVLMLPSFVVVLLALATWQMMRSRRSRSEHEPVAG